MNQEAQTVLKDFSFDKEIWESTKQKLKKRFPELTDEDQSLEDGKEVGLIGKVNANNGDDIGKMNDGLH